MGSVDFPAYAATAGRVLLGCVFLVSAGGKLRRRTAFAAYLDSVAALRLLPPALAPATGVAVLAAECAVVVLLAFGPSVRAGLWLALGLLAVLTFAVARTVRRGVSASCRCFGGAATPFGRRHVVRNVLLLAAAAAALLRPDAPIAGAPALLAAAAGAAAAVLVVTLDDLLELFAPADEPAATSANAGL
ncbi:MauE/DoxX family redox-associated membrane protein [Streptomyces sp. NPDC048604]|uniref:MauE/DoxX family redox-associated membrane protein n=1 Tax=Streptomyces sp. NPDC048604 TaxID=3365578 RepID=UPI003710A94B